MKQLQMYTIKVTEVSVQVAKNSGQSVTSESDSEASELDAAIRGTKRDGDNSLSKYMQYIFIYCCH